MVDYIMQVAPVQFLVGLGLENRTTHGRSFDFRCGVSFGLQPSVALELQIKNQNPAAGRLGIQGLICPLSKPTNVSQIKK